MDIFCFQGTQMSKTAVKGHSSVAVSKGHISQWLLPRNTTIKGSSKGYNSQRLLPRGTTLKGCMDSVLVAKLLTTVLNAKCCMQERSKDKGKMPLNEQVWQCLSGALGQRLEKSSVCLMYCLYIWNRRKTWHFFGKLIVHLLNKIFTVRKQNFAHLGLLGISFSVRGQCRQTHQNVYLHLLANRVRT